MSFKDKNTLKNDFRTGAIPTGEKFSDLIDSAVSMINGKKPDSAGNVTIEYDGDVFTDADKEKLDGIATNANDYTHPTGDGNLHVPATSTTNNGKVLKAGATAGSLSWGTLAKADVGLGNVDDTSDVNKPISTAVQTALNAKANITYVDTKVADLVANAPETMNTLNELATAITKADNALDGLITTIGTKANNSDLTSHTENNTVHITEAERTNWNAKAGTAVATTEANGLMDSTDKTKLDGIATNANNYSLPTATGTVLGGVKVDGTSIVVNSDGVIEAISHTPPTVTIKNDTVEVTTSTDNQIDLPISLVVFAPNSSSYTLFRNTTKVPKSDFTVEPVDGGDLTKGYKVVLKANATPVPIGTFFEFEVNSIVVS